MHNSDYEYEQCIELSGDDGKPLKFDLIKGNVISGPEDIRQVCGIAKGNVVSTVYTEAPIFSPRLLDEKRRSNKIQTKEELISAVSDASVNVVYSGSNRKLSFQQLESKYRKFELDEKILARERELDDFERSLYELCNFWREIGSPPFLEEYQSGLVKRPFLYDKNLPEPPKCPEKPSKKDIRHALYSEELTEALKTVPFELSNWGLFSIVVLPTGAALSLLSSLAFHWSISVLLLVLAVSIVAAYWMFLKGKQERLVKERAEAGTKSKFKSRYKKTIYDWHQQKENLALKYESMCSAFNDERQQVEDSWNAVEDSRIKYVHNLLKGNIEIIKRSIITSLSGTDWPCNSTCEFSFINAKEAKVRFTVPQVNSVVPEQKGRVLKDGRFKRYKRKDRERQYTNFVCGFGIKIASCLFIAGPSLDKVHLLAVDSGSLDERFYDVTINRRDLCFLDYATVDPLFMLQQLPETSLDVGANYKLKKFKGDIPKKGGKLQKSMSNLGQSMHFYSHWLSGTSFGARETYVKSMRVPSWLHLACQRNNEHDIDAIAVMDEDFHFIGYVPNNENIGEIASGLKEFSKDGWQIAGFARNFEIRKDGHVTLRYVIGAGRPDLTPEEFEKWMKRWVEDYAKRNSVGMSQEEIASSEMPVFNGTCVLGKCHSCKIEIRVPIESLSDTEQISRIFKCVNCGSGYSFSRDEFGNVRKG